MHKGAGVHAEIGVPSAAEGHKGVSGGRGASGVVEVSAEGDNQVKKPDQRQGGKGSRELVKTLQERLRMSPLTLRFADQTMEAAYVAKAHAQLFMVRLQSKCD
jgi:hypothetical protein